MASTVLTPTTLVATTSLSDIPNTLVGANKVRSYDVRATNVGAASANVDLVITNGSAINRAKNYPVPYNDPSSAPDLERLLVVPAGWKLQARASAGATVEVSVTGVEDDA